MVGIQNAPVLPLVAALAGTLIVAACTTRAQSTPAAAPPQVGVVLAERRPIVPEVTFTGRVEPVHRVDLRPRVSGALDAILYREGAFVQQGTPLFQIDRRPYDIAVSKAAGERAAAQAQLRHAEGELARAERLAKDDAIAPEEVERRRSEVETLSARVEAARAAHADALLNLEFTAVTAPVSGRIGKAEVTPGNLVVGGPATGTRLARLQSIDPIYVYFDLDPVTADRARTAKRHTWHARVTPFEGKRAVEGPVDFVDNGVSAQSGTLKVRARIANNAGSLLPDSVVKVAFRFGDAEQHTVVPDIAIGTDQGTRSVLVVSSTGELEQRSVTPGPKVGSWRAVSGAVEAGDQIVLPGRPGLRAGMKVQAIPEVLR